MANKRTDWNRIERLYRAGVLTVSEIGRECNVPEANIRYHAKTRCWTRDLSDRVRTTTRTKMVENLANARNWRGVSNSKENKEIIDRLTGATDDQIIEEAARTQVEVVRQHQQTLGSGHSLTLRMLNELDATTTHRGELEDMIKSTIHPRRQGALMTAMSLAGRATIMRDLAQAARIWVTAERQAFNIADDREKDSKESRKLDEMTADQLRKEVVEDARKLGLELTSKDFSQGVVPSKTVNGSGKVH